jgi:hypothetical protein
MSSHYFEKPKDWNIAPRDTWVSGKPIGQNEIGMPKLGDPGAHEDASSQMSFGDDGMGAKNMFRASPEGVVPPGKPCPEGSETKGAACVKTEDSLSSNTIKKQFNRMDKEEDKPKTEKPNFDRELPRAPGPNTQIKKLVKGE